ncbi:MAG TPA: PD-(D/E)XK nuclease family protein [Chryseosolibacter sp.]|nr:PD-(D/E)XK nuclease family protein [Chryseosolibacter sp.]
MKTFLHEVAEKVVANYHPLENVTIVFPNRRAMLYFRKYLGVLIPKPVFSPTLQTVEEFVGSFATSSVPDKLELIHHLYNCYYEVLRKQETAIETEPFDEFFFWGEMLLRDFDETDKYMVNADHLFKDLSHQKELDTSFDYLTEEQKAFLKSFWSNFDEKDSLNKKRFLHVWKKLPEVYNHFRARLAERNLAYDGMLHRDVAERISLIIPNISADRHFVFAGFNALTFAEEKILCEFVLSRHATIYWDIDAYYFNNEQQEAGRFFRDYSNHTILGKTFPADIPAHLFRKETPRKVKVYGAAQPIGQVKLLAEILHDELTRNALNPEETLIVLPDEKLLLPVLHSISETIDKLNVTMGFPLSYTPLFNLIEIIIELQINRKHDQFNHRQALAVLGHPYVVAANPPLANAKRKEILKENWVHIPKSYLASEVNLHRAIFREFATEGGDFNHTLLLYLKEIIKEIGALEHISALDKEYAFQFLQIINRLDTIVGSTGKKTGNEIQLIDGTKSAKQACKSFLRLFRQLSKGQKIPFTGEPLAGLQIMGVLETRNLDYKNVFVLSLNEGSLPGNASKGSYIPFNIRKAYSLPTAEHQDAMYAYLFYRVLQRAENIHLFYNSETDVLGQGEMSRYLQQLIFESGVDIERKILHHQIAPLGIKPITVAKNQNVLEDLFKLNEGNPRFKGISPSALNTYIECSLKFYLRHVAKIREANEVEEELDARVLGNFLHEVMENFYREIRSRKKSKQIEVSDYDNLDDRIHALIDQAFISAYKLDPSKEVDYEGQRVVVREIVKKFALRILELDKSYAPFEMEALEHEGVTHTIKLDREPYKAVIGGKIDRVDKKGNVLRIIDYKTGKDKLEFDSIASLFAQNDKRNKAAFQTLVYAMLYKRNYMPAGESAAYQVQPGLINRINLFDDNFSFGLKAGKDQVRDIEPYLPEFEERLKQLFDELFDAKKPFEQTKEINNCKLCPYTQICYR